MPDRKESAADIVVSVGEEEDVVVERLTLTKEIDIETIYGSNRVYPDGYAINQVSYQGTVELKGNKFDLEEEMFNESGIPVEFDIVITHFDGTSTMFSNCLATSSGWEMSSGESTTTTFEFMALDRTQDGDVDTEPSA